MSEAAVVLEAKSREPPSPRLNPLSVTPLANSPLEHLPRVEAVKILPFTSALPRIRRQKNAVCNAAAGQERAVTGESAIGHRQHAVVFNAAAVARPCAGGPPFSMLM